MADPQIKVIEDKAAIETKGSIDLSNTPTMVSEVIGDEFLYAGRFKPSADLQRALEGRAGHSGEISGLKNFDYVYGLKCKRGEVEVRNGAIHVNLGTNLSIVDGKDRLFAATDGERLIKTELTDDIERIFRPRWNVKLDTENPRSSVAGWEFKTGKALTQFTISEDKESLSITIADPKKNFLCTLMFENLEAEKNKPDTQAFKMILRQGDRGVLLRAKPDKQSYEMIASFDVNDNVDYKAGVQLSEDQIKEIMGISYSHRNIGTIDFDVEFTGDEFECSLNIDIGKMLSKKK